MYWTYLRRELGGRKKHTVIVAAGLAVAIALVIVVNALSAGVRQAQDAALASVYGVGTDLTVTGAAAVPGEPGEGGPGRFEFGEDGGRTEDDGTTSLSQSRLTVEPGRGTLDASVLDEVSGVDGVAAATSALSLSHMTFSGELPEAPTSEGGQTEGGQGGPGQPPAQGGFAGGSFGIDTFTVLGVDPAASGVGPLSAVEVADGRALDADDADARVAVLDASYATSEELSVGDTIEVAGTTIQIVGTVASTSSEADTAAEVYLPIALAQELADADGVVSTVYVQAESADDIAAVQAELEELLPDATVSSQSDLAAGISGSLSSASSLIQNLGTWLSIIVLAVAVLLAVLFTISGVSRRTRELGTLKAIGWSNRRVVGQVAGESLVQGLIGGVAGLVLGLGAIWAINAISPTIATSAGASEPQAGPGAFGPDSGGFGPGGGGPTGLMDGAGASSTTEIVLNAPLTGWILVVAVGLAVVAGLLAGAFGGWRAARLSPAEALRSVA
ncbi:ABC transporter permease [Protaetiibacter sp. SSC-01]|uniref:ABC transporter permease n=1 Tax=Protaetiibacter sp. SSC-01 TaxID=2759943 RepID=UPI001656F520|nr:ABC transporter permease [Protaetiibacter sp. SSC-01]QNO38455.1 ABC transporter permease [Protaetiibacter sp. SSC-01]